jgi:phospholipase C
MAGIDRIEHLFVLMLENRSFDHMLGFSNLEGPDAETGLPTTIHGLKGSESNDFMGQTYRVSQGADYVMSVDPHHEFLDILHQLCGPDARYQPGGTYPPVNNSGFVASYVASGGSQNPGEVMKCFTPEQLPVLHALASEFAVCDNWHASMPGPTWPNRMFIHAGSSGGLDHSPTLAEMVEWETGEGYGFLNNTIFDLLKSKGIPRRIYGGDHFPMVAALKGIGPGDIREYEDFAADLKQDSYPYSYIFIEPSYDVLNNYKGGSSQHPLADIRKGEMLIKTTYEAIRNSPHWGSSLLIITWDENGGFYGHGDVPDAVAPGDSWEKSKYNQYGFTFEKYGPRVPAIVVSPLIPQGVIDHRVYDHTSVLATVEQRFGLVGMTNRDRTANSLLSLLKNAEVRQTLTSLPEPKDYASPETGAPGNSIGGTRTATNRGDTVNKGNLPAIVHSALQQDLRVSSRQRKEILDRVKSIRTVGDAADYMADVDTKLKKNQDSETTH